LHKNISKYLRLPLSQKADRILSCAASAHSNQLASFSAPVAFLFGGLLKGKDSSSMGKSTASWNDFCFFFLP